MIKPKTRRLALPLLSVPDIKFTGGAINETTISDNVQEIASENDQTARDDL
jgi:hypothetical protein